MEHLKTVMQGSANQTCSAKPKSSMPAAHHFQRRHLTMQKKKKKKKNTSNSRKASMQSPNKTLPSNAALLYPTENIRNGAEYREQ
jgi:hypothetical protein